jgi:hypothetical protein
MDRWSVGREVCYFIFHYSNTPPLQYAISPLVVSTALNHNLFEFDL